MCCVLFEEGRKNEIHTHRRHTFGGRPVHWKLPKGKAGKGDMDSAEQTLGGCFLLQVIVSIVLTVVLLLFGENLLLAFGASENTIEYAVSYLNIYAFGTLFVQLTLGMNAFVTAEGFTKISMAPAHGWTPSWQRDR